MSIYETLKEELLDKDKYFQLVVTDENGETLYEKSVLVENPFNFDPTRFLPMQDNKPMTLTRFFEIAGQLIDDAQTRDGVEDAKKVKLVEEYPPDNLAEIGTGDEVLAWRVLRREPAKMNRSGTGRVQRKSLFSYDLRSPDFPNKVIVVESRPVDHLIEFTCWSKTNKQANQRALWLEKLFINHAWAFQVQGVERFFWQDRGADTYTNVNGQRLFYRPINFRVRFREFEMKVHPQIKHFTFDVSSSWEE